MNARITTPMFRIIPRRLACLAALAVSFAIAAIAQTPQTQPSTASQTKPVPLSILYRLFLIHQGDLDALAAQWQAQGKDGSALGNDLETRLGFSDADYAPIRISSQRLASELKPIDDQLKALPRNAASAAQAKALIAQRDAYVSNEMYNLSLELTPQNKTALENFMRQFFAPKQISFKVPAPAGQPAGKAVAQ